jgi:hypothetical protein
MISRRKQVGNYSDRNKRGAYPQRDGVRLRSNCALRGSQLLQKEPEARHHETKSHQCDTRADPGKESPLGGKMIPHIRTLPGLL